MDALVEKLDGLRAGLTAGREEDRQQAEENRARQLVDVSAEVAKLETLVNDILPGLVKEVEPVFERFKDVDLGPLAIRRSEHAAGLRRSVDELSLLINGAYERSVRATLKILREAQPDPSYAAGGEIDHHYQRQVKDAIVMVGNHEGLPAHIQQVKNQIESLLNSIPREFYKERRKVFYPVGSLPELEKARPPQEKPLVKKDYKVIG
jgi:hypothetical protein